MRIDIENTSSPGASFTDNTNDVLLKISDWIAEHESAILPFKEFRMTLQREKGINDNNSRNIYPLLKNGELIRYENRGELAVKNFFTKTGRAYVTALDTKRLIENSDQYSSEQKRDASRKIDTIISEIIRGALSNLLGNEELNYVEPLKWFISYLLRYGKINKTEFAYFLFEKKTKSVEEALDEVEQNILDYRNGTLDFDVNISVRNDIELREKTQSDKRKEGLSFLTSYTYFSSLLQQADIIFKKDGYFILNEKRRNEVEKILEV
jgi:hypothetical protein